MSNPVERTTLLDLPFIQPAQAQKHVTHNEAISLLDVIVQLTVQDFDAVTPSVSPIEGETWALGVDPTGVWVGMGGRIASWQHGGWIFITPDTGWRAWGVVAQELRVFDGSLWAVQGAVDFDNLQGLGVNATSDPVNRLSVASAATLLNHEGAGHQLKLNKADAGDTASLLYQTNWSGRAEIGLAGTDDFAIKVSADGSNFDEAIVVDHANGMVRFPNGIAGSGSVAGALGLQALAFTAECAGNATVGTFLSHGDSATAGPGTAMPFAGRVVAASLAVSGATPGAISVDMAINQTSNPSYQVALTAVGTGVETAVADFSGAPLAFAAGEAIGMEITNSSAASNTFVGTFFVVFD